MKRIVALGFVVAQFAIIPTVSARSLEDIESEQNSVEEEVTQLQEAVSNGLAEASEMSVSLNELNQEIEEHKATISETEQDIEAQEAHVQERFEYTADQLKAMQKSEVNQNIVISVLQAESITELFNAIYSASLLTDASEERLAEAQDEKEKLDDLNEKLLANQEELDAKQTETVKQKEALDNKVADLKQTLAANQDELEQLNTEAAEVRQAQAEAEKAAEEEAVEAASTVSVTSSSSEAETSEESNNSNETNESNESSKAATQTVAANNSNESNETADTNNSSNSNNSNNSANTNNSNESTSSNNSNNETEADDSSQAGAWMSMQATGYSTQQPGLSTHTAQGIDLRVNPNVIAVDPSVIPLGSLVEVQGQGVYVAGDTGGAINGNIIDIHFSTVSQALSWGRRSVNVRIIN